MLLLFVSSWPQNVVADPLWRTYGASAARLPGRVRGRNRRRQGALVEPGALVAEPDEPLTTTTLPRCGPLSLALWMVQ